MCIDVLFDICDIFIQYRFIKTSIPYVWIDYSYSSMHLSLYILINHILTSRVSIDVLFDINHIYIQYRPYIVTCIPVKSIENINISKIVDDHLLFISIYCSIYSLHVFRLLHLNNTRDDIFICGGSGIWEGCAIAVIVVFFISS